MVPFDALCLCFCIYFPFHMNYIFIHFPLCFLFNPVMPSSMLSYGFLLPFYFDRLLSLVLCILFYSLVSLSLSSFSCVPHLFLSYAYESLFVIYHVIFVTVYSPFLLPSLLSMF